MEHEFFRLLFCCLLQNDGQITAHGLDPAAISYTVFNVHEGTVTRDTISLVWVKAETQGKAI